MKMGLSSRWTAVYCIAIIGLQLTVITEALNGQLELEPSDEIRYHKEGGDSVRTMCIFHGNAAGSNLMWNRLKDGKTSPVTEDANHSLDRGSGQLEFTINKPEAGDEGNYTCTAGVEAETLSKGFELKIFKGLDFSKLETNQHADEKRDFVLKCEVHGSPKLEISWRRNGVILDTSGEKYGSDPEGGLIIRSVTRNDAGEYKCVVNQNVNSVLKNRGDKSIHLTVNYPPEMPDTSTVVASNATFICNATGQPAPTIKWGHNSGGQFTPLAPEELTQLTNEPGHSMVSINTTGKASPSEYICLAENVLGSVNRTYRFEARGTDEKPVAPHVTDPSHIQVVGGIPNGSPASTAVLRKWICAALMLVLLRC